MGFSAKKKSASDFNGGNKYTSASKFTADDINNLIEGMLYVQENPSSETVDLGKYTYPLEITTNGETTIEGLFGYSSIVFKVNVTPNLLSRRTVYLSTSTTSNSSNLYTASSDGFDGYVSVQVPKVYVKDLTLEEKDIDFLSYTTCEFETSLSDGLYQKVTITKPNGLQPNNIVKGVSIFGVEGNYTSESFETEIYQPSEFLYYLNGEEKTAIGLSAKDAIIPSSNGYSSLFLNIPNVVTGEITGLSFNDEETSYTYTPPENVNFFDKVTIIRDENLISKNIVKGTIIYGVEGSYQPTDEVVETSKTVTPSAEEQIVTPSDGYTALRQVIVEPIPNLPSGTIEITENGSGIDVSKYAYANVNVSTSTEIKTEICQVNFSTAQQSIFPNKGYYFSEVLVPSIDTVLEEYVVKENSYKNSVTLSTPSTVDYLGFKTVTYPVPVVDDATKVCTIDFSDKSIVQIYCTGDENTEYDFLSSITIYRPDYLEPQYIKSGAEIFGVIGTYAGEEFSTESYEPNEFSYLLNGERQTAIGVQDTEIIKPTNSDGFTAIKLNIPKVTNGVLDTITFSENENSYEYTPPSDVNFFNSIEIKKDNNLKAENILKDVTIYGIKGSINLEDYVKKLGDFGEVTENGTYDITGYESVKVNVPTKKVSAAETYNLNDLDLSTGLQMFLPPDGYDGIESINITVSDVGAIQSIIKYGETIAGIEGTYQLNTDALNEKTITAIDFSEGAYEIIPTAEEVGFKKVTIEKPSGLSPTNIRTGITIAGIAGSLGENLQSEKSVTVSPGTVSTIYPDGNYAGMATVYITVPDEGQILLSDILGKNVGTGTLVYKYFDENPYPNPTSEENSYIGGLRVIGLLAQNNVFPDTIVIPEQALNSFNGFGELDDNNFTWDIDYYYDHVYDVVYIPSYFTEFIDYGLKEKIQTITTIVIPPTVVCVHVNAFVGLTNLQNIIIRGSYDYPLPVNGGEDATFKTADSFFAGLDASQIKVYVPKGNKSAYEADEFWKSTTIIEMEG